jgi:hypothetical protein
LRDVESLKIKVGLTKVFASWCSKIHENIIFCQSERCLENATLATRDKWKSMGHTSPQCYYVGIFFINTIVHG